MRVKKKKYLSLICFSGAGSKLLQAQLNNSKVILTIPAYPLIYLPEFFKLWRNKKLITSSKKILSLILKQHKSLIDSRYLKGFNGLNNLGKDKTSFVKIPQKKFEKNFLKYMKNKDLSLKNTIDGIHHAYESAINSRSKIILYHPHSTEIYSKYLQKDFNGNNLLLITRNPIYNFWRRAYADDRIDVDRYDSTDYEYLKNFRYITRLRDLYINFLFFNSKYKNKSKFLRFEDLILKNSITLRKICKSLNINFNYKNLKTPQYNNKVWNNSKIYKGYDKKKILSTKSVNYPEDLKNFSQYEIFVLEMTLLPFMEKLKYKTKLNTNNKFLNFLKFLIYIFIPTKYGIKLFISRFKIKNICNYFKNLFLETFGKIKIKNYYFNGMYKFKWSYRIAYLIKFNFFRRRLFFSENNYLYKVFYFLSKVLIYPYLQLELLFFYFFRIYLLLALYFLSNNKVKYIKLA